MGRHALGCVFIVKGLCGLFMINDYLKLRHYQETYYTVTSYLSGMPTLELTPKSDLLSQCQFFTQTYFTLQCLFMSAGMLICSNVDFAPYLGSLCIIANNIVFLNPLAQKQSKDQHNALFILFKSVALIGCCCMLFTKGKILEDREDVEFRSPFSRR